MKGKKEIGGTVNAMQLDPRELERKLRRTRLALRRCLKQMENGRPAFTDAGEQWDAVIVNGETVAAL